MMERDTAAAFDALAAMPNTFLLSKPLAIFIASLDSPLVGV